MATKRRRSRIQKQYRGSSSEESSSDDEISLDDIVPKFVTEFKEKGFGFAKLYIKKFDYLNFESDKEMVIDDHLWNEMWRYVCHCSANVFMNYVQLELSSKISKTIQYINNFNGKTDLRFNFLQRIEDETRGFCRVLASKHKPRSVEDTLTGGHTTERGLLHDFIIVKTLGSMILLQTNIVGSHALTATEISDFDNFYTADKQTLLDLELEILLPNDEDRKEENGHLPFIYEFMFLNYDPRTS